MTHSSAGCTPFCRELLGKVSTKGVKLLEGDDFISFASPRMAEALLDTGLTSEQLQPRNLRQHDAKGIVNGSQLYFCISPSREWGSHINSLSKVKWVSVTVCRCRVLV